MTDEAKEVPQFSPWQDIPRGIIEGNATTENVERQGEQTAQGETEVLDVLEQMERIMGRLVHKRIMLLMLEGSGFEEDADAMGVNPAVLKGRREVYNRVEALLDYTGTLGIEDEASYQMWRKAIERILLLIKPLCFKEED